MRRIIASMKFSCIQTSSYGFEITKVTISSSTSKKWTSVHVWWTKSNPHEKDELSQDREITHFILFFFTEQCGFFILHFSRKMNKLEELKRACNPYFDVN